VDDVAIRGVGRLEMLDSDLALVEQLVDVVRTEILQPLEPGLLLRYPEPLAVLGLFVGAPLNADAVEPHRHPEKAVFRQIGQVAPRQLPALFQLLECEILLLDGRHRARSPADFVRDMFYSVDADESIRFYPHDPQLGRDRCRPRSPTG
jgi:hypothetical protein